MIRADVARLSSTYPMVLLSWIVLALAALSPAAIAASALSSRGPDPSGALAIESLLDGGAVLRASWLAFASPVLVLLLASPLLSVAWLRALRQRERLRESIAHGARRYGAALMASLILLPVLGVALGLLGGIPSVVDAVLDDADARAADLWTLAACLPGLAALAAWAAWHDLARARLALSSEGALMAVLGSLRRLRPTAVARYALFFGLGLTLAAVGVVVTGSVPSALALVLGQLFLLARLAVRGVYLAGLVR